MNRTITKLPPEMTGFKPHGTGTAHIQSGDGALFHAALGSIGSDKASFHVWVWTEKPDGTVALVPVATPPNNAPSFAVVSGKLVLYGVLETAPDVRSIVERDIPGYVAPTAAATDPRVTALVVGVRAFLGIK